MAAPDPDHDLAGGIVVPVPANRGRNPGVPVSGLSATSEPFVPSGACGGPSRGDTTGSGGASAALSARGGGGGWGGGATTGGSSSEAFPSLPSPPPRTEERHKLSLVGRARPVRNERGGGGGAAAAEKGGKGGGGGGAGVAGSTEEVRRTAEQCRTNSCSVQDLDLEEYISSKVILCSHDHTNVFESRLHHGSICTRIPSMCCC